VDLSKIAGDLKFMASGPLGGIGEIILPELQKGSSIMPGKINPVMPELINQLYYIVSGNNLSIERAIESAQMELGVMLPTIVEKLLDSLKLTTEAMNKFRSACIIGIKADKKKCEYFLEHSTAYATLLTPHLGYDLVSSLVKKAIAQGKPLKEVVLQGGYLSEKQFDNLCL
jgi:aspartate ammonia-lyase